MLRLCWRLLGHFAFNLDPGVGVYVDGVYLARSVGANTSMLDVDRVEIGPRRHLSSAALGVPIGEKLAA